MNVGRPESNSLERPITTAGQVVVEGRGAEMLFRELVKHRGLSEQIEVRTSDDVSRQTLEAWLQLFTQKAVFKERVRRLGIVRDAERSSAAGAFRSVQVALGKSQLPVPERMQELSGGPLAVGVFILPNCRDPGMIEDLCLEAVSEAEAKLPVGLLPCVEDFFTCLRQRDAVPRNPTKARFAGYALARDVIDPQLRRAAQKGTIPWDARAFNSLNDFLTRLAGP